FQKIRRQMEAPGAPPRTLTWEAMEQIRWHFSTPLEPVPWRSKGCAASPWLTQWPRPRRSQKQQPQPQGLGESTSPLMGARGQCQRCGTGRRRTSSGWPRTGRR
ncbi:T0113319 isoform 1, partial [Pan troglodytes]